MSDESTFHESWHRVSRLHMELRPHLRIHRQHYRGRLWHVIEDPLNNKFFRLRPAAWDFVGRLDGTRTVEEVWQNCLTLHPEEAPGQTEAIHLLGQLHAGNLLASDVPADAKTLFERHTKTRNREIKSQLSSIMFVRIPLLDPDAFLRWALPVMRYVFGRWGALLWLLVVGLGLKTIVENFAGLREAGAGVLSLSNMPLLYCGVVILALLHEMGHAFTCRKLGGEVHTLGLMLLVFTPMPYVDATSSWAFTHRRQRILVAAAGMIVEFFVASLAVLFWANTDPGPIHALAYNIMFAASFSTLLFNINPLLRFDGYYILSDLIGMPNLYSRAQNQVKYLFERYVFGIRNARSQAFTKGEAVILSTYGVASLMYRVVLFFSIILFVSSQVLVLGLILGVYCFFGWAVLPFGKFIRYLLSSPRLERTRKRAIAASLAMAVIPLLLLGIVPAPKSIKAPGVVHAERFQSVAPEASGRLAQVFEPSGRVVKQGTPLLRLEDSELDYELRMALAQREEVQARRAQALHAGGADIDSVAKLGESIEARIDFLKTKQANLVLRAPMDGLWVAPDLTKAQNRWFARGEALGLLLQNDEMRFNAVVDQDYAGYLSDPLKPIKGAELRLSGQSDVTLRLPAQDLQVIEGERRVLPSAALGWQGGGDIAVSAAQGEGRVASEGFFEVRAHMAATDQLVMLHGQRGQMRILLPGEPYLRQWTTSLQQLFQKTYGPDARN